MGGFDTVTCTEDVGYLFLRKVIPSARLRGVITEDHVQLQCHSTIFKT